MQKKENVFYKIWRILDGIGETQIKSLEIFFSNKKNSEITQSLMSILNIKDFEKLIKQEN